MAQYSVQQQKHLGHATDIHEVVMLADKFGNILNTFGSASNIPIAAGALEGYSHINKFGATDGDITAGTVWDGNSGSDLYPYPAAGAVNVIGVSGPADDGKIVEVQGLDDSYNLVVENVAIGTGFSGTIFSRVFRARMVDANNTQDIEILQGGALAAKILEGLGQTLMAVYTVPAGKTAYLLDLHMGSDKASTNTAMTYRLFARPFGGAFNIKGNFNAAGGQSLDINYPVPLRFEEMTDIRVDALAGQATQVSATFDLILVDN
jgi:hypothetical protein